MSTSLSSKGLSDNEDALDVSMVSADLVDLSVIDASIDLFLASIDGSGSSSDT